MALESLDHQIDIRDLNIDSPETRDGLPFDPERDITEPEREAMVEFMKAQRVDGKTGAALDLGKNLKQMFTDRVEEASIIDEQMLRHIEFIFINTMDHNDKKQIASQVDVFAAVAALYEEDYDFPKLGEDEYKLFERLLSTELLIENRLMPVLRHIKNFTILNFDDKRLDSLKNEAEKRVRQNLREMVKNQTAELKNYWWAITAMANAKVLFPKSVNLTWLGKGDWEQMRDFAESEYRGKGEWGKYAELCACMQIIAAETVRLTPRGVEVIMGKGEFSPQSSSDMPAERKF